MIHETHSPYSPPTPLQSVAESEHTHSPRGSTQLAWLGLVLSAMGLLGPVLFICLALLGVMELTWLRALPDPAFFVCVPLTVTGMILSVMAYVNSRSWATVFGVLFAVLAFLGSLAATFIEVIFEVAGHPI